ncbi:hypothetical protein ACFE04_026008 [Oxalis oulophora]
MDMDDDMNSLFEGMVLFTPSQLSAPPSSVDNTHQSTPSPSQSEPLEDNLFSDLSIVVSQPETLTPPDHQLDDDDSTSVSSSSTTSIAYVTTNNNNINNNRPTITRQGSSSRKKKRAAGLRVGYGRDYHEDHDYPTLSPSQSDQQPSPITSLQDSTQNENVPSPLPVDHFVVLQAQISDKLKCARQLASSASSARKDAVVGRRKAAQNVELASLNLVELEKQLEEACETEDFEAAERISQSLAAAETQKQDYIAALRDAEALCDSIESKMLDALHSQIAAEEESASLLIHFSTDAMGTADSILQKAEEESLKEMDGWFSSNEALETQKIELEIESVIVNDARELFKSSIDHSVEDDAREREALLKKKDVLAEELEELLALVKKKQDEIEENDFKIKEVDEKISSVVSGFQEMQSNIDKKCDDLHSSHSQLDLKTETLLTKKKEIDDSFATEQERGAKLKELATKSLEEANTYREVAGLRKSLMLSALNSTEDKTMLAKNEEKLSEEVQRLQREVSSARASLQELSSTKSSVQQNVASLKQRISSMDKRVPELEAEKKIAAAARNFKEAARLAAEAKSLSGEKDNVQIELDEASLKLEKLEEEIKDTVNRLQETEGLILAKEKEVAMARFQRLLLTAGSAKAERSAALELGDDEEASLLLAEAESAESEAKKLQVAYNLKDEELADLPKTFISLELVSNLGLKQLQELMASVNLPRKE